MTEEQQQPQPVQEDLSSKTILLLVILTLAVSFIGAWVNINTAMTATAPQETASQTAEVSFHIREQPVPQQSTTTGMVSLTLTQ